MLISALVSPEICKIYNLRFTSKIHFLLLPCPLCVHHSYIVILIHLNIAFIMTYHSSHHSVVFSEAHATFTQLPSVFHVASCLMTTSTLILVSDAPSAGQNISRQSLLRTGGIQQPMSKPAFNETLFGTFLTVSSFTNPVSRSSIHSLHPMCDYVKITNKAFFDRNEGSFNPTHTINN